jgi:NAD-dependent dihydropyrimidine dehydrogenase PreA subunit
MQTIRYLSGVATLQLDRSICVGCGICTEVCPHAVFAVQDGRAVVVDSDGCMECGACALNCPVTAIAVNPGVGCAEAIVNGWLNKIFPGRQSSCC